MNKRIKYTILAGSFYLALLPTSYSETQMDLVSCERKYGVEATLKASDMWLKNYEDSWYTKPFKFTSKWAVDSYIKDHQKE